MGPTAPTAAFKIGAKTDDPVQMYLNDIFTVAANLTGAPAMSIPCGFDRSGLPIGLQIQGNYFAEAKILNVAHRYQQVTDWHNPLGDRLDTRIAPREATRSAMLGSGKSSSASRRTRSCRPRRRFFSGASTAFGAAPNTQASAVDIALPGVLPVLNKGAVERAIRFGPGGRRDHQPAQRVRAQELLLPRSAEGLSDQPVRDPGRAGRIADDHHCAGRQDGAAHPRPSRGGRRQVAARGFSRHDRHRPQPRRHAAARDRLRAGPAQRRGSGRVREGAACAGALDRHLRRQHAGRQLPLRRQRLGAAAGRARSSARAARSRT